MPLADHDALGSSLDGGVTVDVVTRAGRCSDARDASTAEGCVEEPGSSYPFSSEVFGVVVDASVLANDFGSVTERMCGGGFHSAILEAASVVTCEAILPPAESWWSGWT